MMMKFWIEVAPYCISEVLAQHWYEGGEAIFGKITLIGYIQKR